MTIWLRHILRHPLSVALLAMSLSAPSFAEKPLDGKVPVVIAHRGASGYRPEHTLAAYQLAIDMGADFIEPDLVSTKDGVLIARHEPLLAIFNESTRKITEATTNVAELPQFADRRTTRVLDGTPINGWWVQDFTLAEIKILRARERIPAVRPDNTAYNDQFEIPTFQEIIDLANTASVKLGRPIGLYPETKHPTFHDSAGLSLEEPLVAALKANELPSPAVPVFIQSFEVTNLKNLRRRSDISVRLVQLFESSGRPYDFVVARNPRSYDDMATAAGLVEIATYADGVGPNKSRVIPVIAGKLADKPTSFVADAHAHRLVVHPYTFRRENTFLPRPFDRGTKPSDAGNLHDELVAYLNAGIDGFFSDNPDIGRNALK